MKLTLPSLAETPVVQSKQRRRWFATLISAVFAIGLSGCSSESDTTASAEDGELVISLTDAEGDFGVYSVDVTSIQLTKANGAVVETLPLTTTIDFTQYVDLTEFLTAATIPSGTYKQATLTLDYSNAVIEVEGSDGLPVTITNIRDRDGSPVVTLDVAVKLENQNSLTIAPGVPALLALDFDLQSSHVVDLDNPDGPSITIEPVLIADIDAESPKVHRVRGPVHHVDVTDHSYDVIIRPFHAAISDDNRFGKLTVITDVDTVFEIDGESYNGDDGLVALEALPAFTASIAKGSLRLNPRRFIASEVYAGSSVPGGDQDVVSGSVVARTGNQITVKGATLVRADGRVIFRNLVTVELADTTLVKKQLSTDAHSIDDVSVGQRVRVFGELTNSDEEPPALDASQGMLRMLLSTARGVVVESDQGNDLLTLDINALNRRPVQIYDFSGTGIDAANDANPEAYEVNTSTLDLTEFTANTATVARGFVTPFGSAPADFDAQTLVDVSALRAILTTSWTGGTNTPFTNMSEASLTLNTDDVGRFHTISQGGVMIDITELEDDIVITADDETSGIYLIIQRDSTELLADFGDFVIELQRRLDGGALMHHLMVPGQFDPASAQISTHRITVHLN